jgi:hypothetical protein
MNIINHNLKGWLTLTGIFTNNIEEKITTPRYITSGSIYIWLRQS